MIAALTLAAGYVFFLLLILIMGLILVLYVLIPALFMKESYNLAVKIRYAKLDDFFQRDTPKKKWVFRLTLVALFIILLILWNAWQSR